MAPETCTRLPCSLRYLRKISRSLIFFFVVLVVGSSSERFDESKAKSLSGVVSQVAEGGRGHRFCAHTGQRSSGTNDGNLWCLLKRIVPAAFLAFKKPTLGVISPYFLSPCLDPLLESPRNPEQAAVDCVLQTFSYPTQFFGEEVTGEAAWLIRADIPSFEMLNLLDGTWLALM